MGRAKNPDKDAMDVSKRKIKKASMEVTEEEHKKLLASTMGMWNWAEADLGNPAEVESRILKYFDICTNEDIKPNLEGVAYCLGKDIKEITEIATGDKEGIPSTTVKVIRRAVQAMRKYMVDLMMNNKIIPVSGIFLLKNLHGFRDNAEVVIDVRRPIQNPSTTAELAEKYMVETTDYKVE